LIVFITCRYWQSLGVEVSIDTSNVFTLSGCNALLRNTIKLGPVEGIFNLAVALRDGIFENQTLKMFEESLAPKAVATKHLDELSRKLCPDLKQFVIFSSVSCGRGNAGQSNYGMANSIMERIIEQRAELGLPAKAIQWGAVGDVGLLAELHEKNMDMEIGGTLPQRIENCLVVLESMLKSEEPIVASMVVAEKRFGDATKNNVVDAVLNILSISDRKLISMNAPLSRLGLDSLMGVEIQQVLERDFGLPLSSQELRAISLSQLEKFVQSKDSKQDFSIRHDLVVENLEILLTSFGDESTVDQRIMKLQSKTETEGTKILIIPGIDGMAGEEWHQIAAGLKSPTYVLQMGRDTEAKEFKELLNSVSKVCAKITKDRDAELFSDILLWRNSFKLESGHSFCLKIFKKCIFIITSPRITVLVILSLCNNFLTARWER
jgi:fatty acid synthase, animal type